MVCHCRVQPYAQALETARKDVVAALTITLLAAAIDYHQVVKIIAIEVPGFHPYIGVVCLGIIDFEAAHNVETGIQDKHGLHAGQDEIGTAVIVEVSDGKIPHEVVVMVPFAPS